VDPQPVVRSDGCHELLPKTREVKPVQIYFIVAKCSFSEILSEPKQGCFQSQR